MLEGLTPEDIGSLVTEKQWAIGTLTDIFGDGTVEVDWGRINHNDIIGKERLESNRLYWYARMKIPTIEKVETTDDLIMVLFFDNGEVRSLDFKKENLSGSLSPLKDKEFFKKAFVSEYGMVEFPNDIQLDPVGLYNDSDEGDRRQSKLIAALKKFT